MALDPTTAVIEWLDWLAVSEHGKSKLFPPSLESVDIADKAAHMRGFGERKWQVPGKFSSRGKSCILNFLLLYPWINWS